MSDDLIATARRAKGSEILPTVSFGVLNAETLILRMADRIEALEAKLAKAVEALREIADAFGCECGDAARAALAEIEGDKP